MVTYSDTVRLVRSGTSAIRGMIRRATGSYSKGAIRTNDSDDRVELFEPYGFTSGPPLGSDGLVLRPGAERAHSIAIMFHDPSVKLVVDQGEVALYHPEGTRVILRNDGIVEVVGQVIIGDPSGDQQAVARATDPVVADERMDAWITAISSAVGTMSAAFNVAGPLIGAPGTIAPPVLADIIPPTDFGLIEEGGEGATCS